MPEQFFGQGSEALPLVQAELTFTVQPLPRVCMRQHTVRYSHLFPFQTVKCISSTNARCCLWEYGQACVCAVPPQGTSSLHSGSWTFLLSPRGKKSVHMRCSVSMRRQAHRVTQASLANSLPTVQKKYLLDSDCLLSPNKDTLKSTFIIVAPLSTCQWFLQWLCISCKLLHVFFLGGGDLANCGSKTFHWGEGMGKERKIKIHILVDNSLWRPCKGLVRQF